MLKIALCDSDYGTFLQFQRIVEEHFASLIQIDEFSSGEAFCLALKQGNQWNLIVLDTNLTQLNGIEICELLRGYPNGQRFNILFISAQRDHVIDYFKYRPIGFLLKPLLEEDIIDNLNYALEHAKEIFMHFEFSIHKEVHRIPYDQICYFESNNKAIIIHGRNTCYQCYGSLETIQKMAGLHGFVRIHYSYLVNWNNVVKYSLNQVVLENGECLSVSRTYRLNVKNRI